MKYRKRLLYYGMLACFLVGCSNLNRLINNKNENIGESTHEHTFSDDWSYDSETHWHPCTCGHDAINKEEHLFGDWFIASSGEEERVCSICRYKETKGRQILNLRNLYFQSWDGSDRITQHIENKFNVEIHPNSYDYDNWDRQVLSQIYVDNISDVFHFNVSPYNFSKTYKPWAESGIIKPLPDDLSSWPNIKGLIDNISNLSSLKINGHVYGIPLIYNINKPNVDFTSYTYLYRRDWLRNIRPDLVHENDVYTWDEFINIINAFCTRQDVLSGNSSVIGDVSWGFPSLTTFFKNSNGCYSLNSNNEVVNNFTTDEYIKGLNITKSLTLGNYAYFDEVSNIYNTRVYDAYKNGHLGIYYENLSHSNYSTLRKDIRNINETLTDERLNDMTAIMKVKGPDGKFHLEGSENWFSMTFFNYEMSEEKQIKLLDIMDYLLSEEGTRLSIYGIENEDYIINSLGEIELIDEMWPAASNGQYAFKYNGAKFLRYMMTLGYDTLQDDPYTDLASFNITNAWEESMMNAKTTNDLVLVKEPENIAWMSTPLKDDNTESMIEEGKTYSIGYCYGVSDFSTIEDYVSKFNTNKWNNTISQINEYLNT